VTPQDATLLGGQVVDAPRDALLEACLHGQLARRLLVGEGELQVLGPRRARLQQLDLQLADAPADLQDAGASTPSACRNPTIVCAVASRPRLRYRLASLRPNRWVKKWG
jgi:hypothetical protein